MITTRELWIINTQAREAHDVRITGAELMRRTDRSPARCERANAEQAKRREEMRRTGFVR
jgi:hypothetical protein